MFECLDEDRTGMVSASDIVNLLEIGERLKSASFDQQKYNEQKSITSPQLSNKLALMTKEVTELISSFDLTGDRLLSPEEFFNIIMYAYGY